MAENVREKSPKKKRRPRVKHYTNNHTLFKFLLPGKNDMGYRDYLETLSIGEIDFPFLIIVCVLLAMGLIMMYSASYAWAIHDTKDNIYDFYFMSQFRFALIGFGVMFLASSKLFDYHLIKNPVITFGFTAVSFAMLVATPFIGYTVGGATRWLVVGPLRFQPSEIMKIALIFLFAHLMSTNSNRMKTLMGGIIPYVGILIVVIFFMLLQPHLSGAIIIATIGFAMMFAAGCRIDQFLAFLVLGAAGMVAGAYALYMSGYEFIKNRIDGWLYTFNSENTDIAWQTRNSLIAIGSGGWFGLGFGQSRQKNLYLPESQNDFVFSIVCEELGFVGALCVIVLFVMLIVRGVYIACHAPDKYGFLIVTGITVQLGLQAFLNMGVVSNAMPNTGISLPFFSYGGTALVMQMFEIGIILNVSRQRAEEVPKPSAEDNEPEQTPTITEA